MFEGNTEETIQTLNIEDRNCKDCGTIKIGGNVDNKTLIELQEFDNILNNLNVNATPNESDREHIKEIETIVNDINASRAPDNTDIKIHYSHDAKPESLYLLQNVDIVNIEHLCKNIKNENIIKANFDNALSNKLPVDVIHNVSNFYLTVNNNIHEDIDFHNEFGKNENNRNMGFTVEVNIENLNRNETNFTNGNLNSTHKIKSITAPEHFDIAPKFHSWFTYCSNKSGSNKTEGGNDLEIGKHINISRTSKKNLSIKQEKPESDILTDNLFDADNSEVSSNFMNKDVSENDVLKNESIFNSVNNLKEELEINVSYDSDGYNSSDFEFINEDEAKQICFIDKNSDSNSLSADIFPEFSEELFINDYFHTLTSSSSIKNVIPNGDDYYELFLENANRIPFAQMENKSICKMSTMHVEMQVFGLLSQEHDEDPRLQEEAEDCAKAIRAMYPDENRRRR